MANKIEVKLLVFTYSYPQLAQIRKGLEGSQRYVFTGDNYYTVDDKDLLDGFLQGSRREAVRNNAAFIGLTGGMIGELVPIIRSVSKAIERVVLLKGTGEDELVGGIKKGVVVDEINFRVLSVGDTSTDLTGVFDKFFDSLRSRR